MVFSASSCRSASRDMKVGQFATVLIPRSSLSCSQGPTLSPDRSGSGAYSSFVNRRIQQDSLICFFYVLIKNILLERMCSGLDHDIVDRKNSSQRSIMVDYRKTPYPLRAQGLQGSVEIVIGSTSVERRRHHVANEKFPMLSAPGFPEQSRC